MTSLRRMSLWSAISAAVIQDEEATVASFCMYWLIVHKHLDKGRRCSASEPHPEEGFASFHGLRHWSLSIIHIHPGLHPLLPHSLKASLAPGMY